MLFSYCSAEVVAGRLAPEATPVNGIECYEEFSGIQGVGGLAMETRYAIKLQLE